MMHTRFTLKTLRGFMKAHCTVLNYVFPLLSEVKNTLTVITDDVKIFMSISALKVIILLVYTTNGYENTDE